MNKKLFAGMVLAFVLAVSSAFADGEFSVTLEFSASALEIENTKGFTDIPDPTGSGGPDIRSRNDYGNVDSFGDSTFEDDSEVTISYEGEKFGGTVALGLPDINYHLIMSEEDLVAQLRFPELYGWIKPFGNIVKFTAGIFSNTDGIGDYTDDIDDFGIGVFIMGEEGDSFSEPMKYTDASLSDGFLTDVYLGPVTLQVLFGPNFGNNRTLSRVFGEDLITVASALGIEDEPLYGMYRIGTRIYAEFEDIGTFALMFKTMQFSRSTIEKTILFEVLGAALEADPNPTTAIPTGYTNFYTLYPNDVPGGAVNYHAFGGYADITAIENLGISLGYTGFVWANSDSSRNSVLFHGIDLRATWTGIEGLSISTHNNISFASGSDNEWYKQLGAGGSFFNLYNAIGATKTLTETLSINAQIGNILSRLYTDENDPVWGSFIGLDLLSPDRTYHEFWVEAKLIASVTENAQLKVGLKVAVADDDIFDSTDTYATTTFSIPVAISLTF
jgi:hypothetical protein